MWLWLVYGGDEMKQVFKIPLKIDSKLSTNKIYSSIHWNTRKNDKDNMKLLVRSVVGLQQAYEKPVHLKMSFKSKLDVSNHTYLFKMIEDSLVKCGLLKNDNDKYVKRITLEKQKEFDGVIVEVEEME